MFHQEILKQKMLKGKNYGNKNFRFTKTANVVPGELVFIHLPQEDNSKFCCNQGPCRY